MANYFKEYTASPRALAEALSEAEGDGSLRFLERFGWFLGEYGGIFSEKQIEVLEHFLDIERMSLRLEQPARVKFYLEEYLSEEEYDG